MDTSVYQNFAKKKNHVTVYIPLSFPLSTLISIRDSLLFKQIATYISLSIFSLYVCEKHKSKKKKVITVSLEIANFYLKTKRLVNTYHPPSLLPFFFSYYLDPCMYDLIHWLNFWAKHLDRGYPTRHQRKYSRLRMPWEGRLLKIVHRPVDPKFVKAGISRPQGGGEVWSRLLGCRSSQNRGARQCRYQSPQDAGKGRRPSRLPEIQTKDTRTSG